MKKILKIIKLVSIVSVIACAIIVPTIEVLAQPNQDPYIPLAPIPGTTETCSGPNCGTKLPTYLTGMFKVGIVLAGVLAFLMIVLGGFQYLSTDALTGKEEGRERIERAIGGLILALTSYIILYTINPALVKIDLTFFGQAYSKNLLDVPDNAQNSASYKQFVDAQEKRVAAVTNDASGKDALAAEMIRAVDEGYYLGVPVDENQRLYLLSEASKLQSESLFDKTTANIATASNLGTVLVNEKNTATALAKLSEIKTLEMKGINDISAIDPRLPILDDLILNGSRKYATLASDIAVHSIINKEANPTAVANSMIRAIDSNVTYVVSKINDQSKIDLLIKETDEQKKKITDELAKIR